MPECGGRPNTLFFSEDGPYHVQRRLVTGKTIVQPTVPPDAGKRGREQARGPSGIYICQLRDAVKETSRSLGYRQVLTTTRPTPRGGNIFGTQEQEQARIMPAGSANTSISDNILRRHRLPQGSVGSEPSQFVINTPPLFLVVSGQRKLFSITITATIVLSAVEHAPYLCKIRRKHLNIKKQNRC